jgi:hypothetical protein
MSKRAKETRALFKLQAPNADYECILYAVDDTKNQTDLEVSTVISSIHSRSGQILGNSHMPISCGTSRLYSELTPSHVQTC